MKIQSILSRNTQVYNNQIYHLIYHNYKQIKKLLDKTVNIDGLWSYNIYAERIVDDNDEIKFVFRTKTNGNDTCRAVQGCFRDKYIEPNLKKVIDRIKEFELTGEPEPEPEPTVEDSTLTNEVKSNEDLVESEDNFLDLN